MQMGDGPQLMEACVDPNELIQETDETNNCLRLTMAPGGFVGDLPDAYEIDNDWAHAGTLSDTDDAARAQEHSLHRGDDVDVMKFTLTQDDQIHLRITDVLGQLVVTLVDGPVQAGDAGRRMETVLSLDDEGQATSDELSAGTYAFEVRSADELAVPRYKINAWSRLGPYRPDAGAAPPTEEPPGECADHEDCTGGQRCVVDDREPYCTNACDTIADCPEGFQLTCREIGPGTKACIRGEAPPTAPTIPAAEGCSCATGGGGAGLLGFLGLVGLVLRRRRRRLP